MQELLNESEPAETMDTMTSPLAAVEKAKNLSKSSEAKKGNSAPVLAGKGLLPVPNMPSSSEATIYKRAVRELAPELEEQIERFIIDTRKAETPQACKVSYSSDELMDTSDELETNLANVHLVTGSATKPPKTPVLSPEERADQVIRDSEKTKTTMYEVKGKNNCNLNQIALMDNDYQMIDAHVEDSFKRMILSFDYIDLSKLLTKSRLWDEEQKLELVSRNGMAYLSPADKEGMQITSYMKWEQAFRVYSNIITTYFPEKLSELLQYNHTIHTASMTYTWDNVYAYDKEFRYHIGRHPTRAWNVILQQAWTMLLKDRQWFDAGGNSNHRNKHGKRGEPCRRYNKGRCTFGASCKFEHRCSVKKCGKYGHGAHICHLRDTEEQRPENGPNVAAGIQESKK